MHLHSIATARHCAALLLAAFAIVAVALLQPFAAAAHENRDVGEYAFEVGFVNEPAIQGDTNGIFVSVTQADAPVEGLADTLQAQAIFGDQTRDFALTPYTGEHVGYSATFIPSEPGDYTFRIFGQINGVDVDETFTSSPEGFDSVQARADVEFPGSTGEVGTNGDDTMSVAMPLTAGLVVLVLGAGGLALRRRSA